MCSRTSDSIRVGNSKVAENHQMDFRLTARLAAIFPYQNNDHVGMVTLNNNQNN
jgi:hypothetical protein